MKVGNHSGVDDANYVYCDSHVDVAWLRWAAFANAENVAFGILIGWAIVDAVGAGG